MCYIKCIWDSLVLTAAIIFLTVSCEGANLIKCKGASTNGTHTVPYHQMENNETTTFTFLEKTPDCDLVKVVNTDGIIKFTKFGDISIADELFSTNEYCIDRAINDELQVKYCNFTCGETHVCIPKCCSRSEMLTLQPHIACSDPGESYSTWNPAVYADNQYERCETKEEGWKLHYRHEQLSCPPDNMHLHHRKTIEFFGETEPGFIIRILRNGTVMINPEPGNWKSLETGNFCIDTFQFHNNFSGDSNDFAVVACGITEETKGNSVDLPYIIAGVLIFSSTFSFATTVVYLCLWDKHNIHGWTIFCFNLSMLLMFLFLATAHLTSSMYDNTDAGSPRCRFIGIMTHFFFLSMFCFMTMINVDLFTTFKRLSPTTTKVQQFRRFGLYLLFALGVPVIVVGISVILDQTVDPHPKLVSSKEDLDCNEWVAPITLPEYGQQSCYLSEKSRGYYLYYPIGCLLLLNLLLFISTVYTLWQYKQSTKSATAGSSSSQNNKQNFLILTKLVIVMGISWIFEVISWLADNQHSYWIIFDLINLLSPLAIFFIFVCKREIAIMLYQKYPCVRAILKSGLPCCKVGLMDPEATDMTGIEKSKVHYRNSSSSYN